MGSFEITCPDLESGDDRRSSSMSGGDEESLFFSETYEGSCYYQSCSTTDGSIDVYTVDSIIEEILDSRRVLTMDDSDCSVDIKSTGVDEFNVFLVPMGGDCRICHLSLQDDGSDTDYGIGIELGCSCKNDLAAAHQHCAETWFRIKGNKICEICNLIARNVVGSDHIELPQQVGETNTWSGNAASVMPSTNLVVTPPYGYLFIIFFFACIVFAVFLASMDISLPHGMTCMLQRRRNTMI